MAPTTSYPIDEPHLEALLWACGMMTSAWFREHAKATADGPPPEEDAWKPKHDALRALSSPASAASLVRDMLARAACTVPVVYVYETMVRIAFSDAEIEPDVPRLISALCDLAPGDKEGAMRALREVGK